MGPLVQGGIFEGPSRKPRTLVVATREFGYLGSASSSTAFVPIYGRISMSKVSGPTLCADEILTQLGQGYLGGLRHLCGACLEAGVPATIKAIANGQMCELPGCPEKTETRCKCCGAAFCLRHTGSTNADSFQLASARRKYWDQDIARVRGDMGISGKGPQVYLRGPELVGLCPMCESERTEEARQAIISICDSWPEIAREADGSTRIATYDVHTPLLVTLFDNWFYTLEIKRKRAQGICDRLEKAVAEKNRELARRSTPCVRNQGTEKAGGYRFIAPRNGTSRTPA